MKIKIIFTGGTISSRLNENVISVETENFSKMQLIENFNKASNFADIEFISSQPLNVLSENMSINNLNTLINEIKNTNFSEIDGIIITHGTDTLGYTANILAILLAGIKIPVVLVSSNYILSDEKSNGNDNFFNAVDFIKKKQDLHWSLCCVS